MTAVRLALAIGLAASLGACGGGAATATSGSATSGSATSGSTTSGSTTSTSGASSTTSGTTTTTTSTTTTTTTTADTSATTPAALAAKAVDAANAFRATLTSGQQASVQLGWDLATARRWSNLPASMVARNGVAWSALNDTQRAAARTLIETALGATGNTLHLGMQAADDALVSLYGANASYGAGNYYVALLGTPSATGFWVLQLTGHHLTYNIAFSGSANVTTPMFLGVEPRGAFTLNGAAWDPMQAQRTAVADLGAALVAYPQALLAGTWTDLLFGANGSGGIDGAYPKAYPTGTSGRGVPVASLSAADRTKVEAVVRAYVNTAATPYAAEILAAYLDPAALAQTYVAYSGDGTVDRSGNYLRVDGPRVWIEFSVQNGIIVRSDVHYHSIWRDKTGDYGGRCCS